MDALTEILTGHERSPGLGKPKVRGLVATSLSICPICRSRGAATSIGSSATT